MRLDPLERGDQRIAEIVGVGKAGEPRDAGKLLRLGGDDMGLLIADHLQPVLDPAEEQISLGKLDRGLARDPAAFAPSDRAFQPCHASGARGDARRR